LANIGNILSREQILEAIIAPSERLSPGFGMESLTLKDGKNITGTLLEEGETVLVVRASEASITVPILSIAKRENMASSMPPMGAIMSKRELRDMIAFLYAQKAAN
jgi:putative heme-binding domain-containing protein